MKRQFRYGYTVRYDEGDSYGLMKPAAFLRYMQDIASMDAESVQLEGNGYWVAKRTVISFVSQVPVHTELKLKTYGIGFTRITAQRAYDAHLPGKEEDEPVVSARTLWVYLDQRGRPTRLPERTSEIWLPDGPEPQVPDLPWSAFPERAPERIEYTVHFSDIDVMKHMNNATYVEVLDNAAWEVYAKAGITPENAVIQVLDYDIEYLESARLGDILEVQIWLEPLPAPGQRFTRLQRIMRNGSVLLRARSHWQWKG